VLSIAYAFCVPTSISIAVCLSIYIYLSRSRSFYLYLHIYITHQEFDSPSLNVRATRRTSSSFIDLAFTRYCHHQQCSVYGSVCRLPLDPPPPPPPYTTNSNGTLRSVDTQSAGPANTGPRRTATEDSGRVRNNWTHRESERGRAVRNVIAIVFQSCGKCR